jgi:hypothetical protein
MNINKNNPLNRDQALNDVTSGQMGEPMSIPESREKIESHIKAARRLSEEIE